MITLKSSEIIGLIDKSNNAADKIIASLKLLKVVFDSPSTVELEHEMIEILMLRNRDDIDDLFELIREFPKNNSLILPDFNDHVISKIDLLINDSSGMLEVLSICYGERKQMPFSKNILSSVMDELIKNISCVVACVDDYYEGMNQKEKS